MSAEAYYIGGITVNKEKELRNEKVMDQEKIDVKKKSKELVRKRQNYVKKAERKISISIFKISQISNGIRKVGDKLVKKKRNKERAWQFPRK